MSDVINNSQKAQQDLLKEHSGYRVPCEVKLCSYCKLPLCHHGNCIDPLCNIGKTQTTLCTCYSCYAFSKLQQRFNIRRYKIAKQQT